MNEQVVKLLIYIGVALALMGVGAAGAWMWQANSYGKIVSDNTASYLSDLTMIANAGAAQARQALEKQQVAEQALADLDQKAQKEKTDALAENDKLRSAVASGARRLRIAGSCRASIGDVPGPASTTSVDNAGTVELSATAGSTVLAARSGIIADQAALKALQDYVTHVCLRVGNVQ